MKFKWIKQFSMSLIWACMLMACHSFKQENIHPPTPLVKKLTPTVQVNRLWEDQVGQGAGASGVRMRPIVVDGILYAASTDGTVAAIDAHTGKRIWTRHSPQHNWCNQNDKKLRDTLYAGGPAVVGNLLVVGTLDGHVYGIDSHSGTWRWTATLDAEVIDSPVISSHMVIVRTQSGKVYGLDSRHGKRHWLYDQSTMPLLSLRGNSPLLTMGDMVFFGSDDGKLIALRQNNGEKLWELPLANGGGRTDIERLDDADGALVLDGQTVYGAAFHGNLVAVNAMNGQPLWSHPFSTYTALALGGQVLYGVDDTSQVWAFDKSVGIDLWKNDKLRYRWLSAPAVQGDYVVVGDMDGYVHWLQTTDGALAARQQLYRREAIRAQPVVVDDVVYIEDVAGHIAAYRIDHHL